MSAAGAESLRRHLRDGLVVAPGAHDAVSARIAEHCGFTALYISGAATTAVLLGQPDLGFLGLSDVTEQVRRVRAGTGLPLIVDADTGYGNALQVGETVQRLADAGAAAVQLEDQVAPKRCGQLRGKEVVEPSEMCRRLRAASKHRRETLVIARTDALVVGGLQAVVERLATYAGEGADLVLPAGVVDPAQLAAVRAVTGDADLVVNVSESVEAPHWPTLVELVDAGARLVIFPVTALLAAVTATRDTFERIHRLGVAGRGDSAEWHRLEDELGLADLLTLEEQLSANRSAGSS